MKSTLLFALALLFFSDTYAQNFNHTFDLKIGMGNSFLGTGDVLTRTFEGELNFNINNYFSVAPAVQYGYSLSGGNIASNFSNQGVNFFISPFKNSKIIDFKIGGGTSMYQVKNITYLTSVVYEDRGQLYELKEEQYSTYGLNMIVESNLHLGSRFLLGLKVYSTPYKNGDIASGILLKFGAVLDRD